MTPALRTPSRLPRLVPLLAGCGVLVACVLVAQVLLGAGSEGLPLAAAALAALVAVVLWAALGSLRRLLLAGVFVFAALDISKAVVPPLERFFSPGLYITVAQALLVVWALWFVLHRVLVQRRALPFTALDGWALAYLAVVWWAALRSPAGDLAVASAVAYSLCVLGYYVVSHGLATLDDVRLALRALLITFALQALFVGVQMALRAPVVLPGIKVATGTEMTLALGDADAFRPIGLFNHPNVMADYTLWFTLPALALVLMGRRRLAPGVWMGAWAVLVVGTGMLLASLSRGGWMAFALGAVVLGAVYGRARLIGRSHVMVALLIAVLAGVAVVAVYPQVLLRLTEPDARSTESRVLLADQALAIIRSQPWLGVGFGGYNRAAFDHWPASWALVSADYQQALLKLVVHNQYLLTAAEQGLPALALWVVLLVRFARQAWPLSQWAQPGLFALGTGLGAAVIAHMLYLASDNYYVDIRIALLWLAAGMLQALTRLAPRPTGTSAGPPRGQRAGLGAARRSARSSAAMRGGV